MARLLDTLLLEPAERKSAYIEQFSNHEVPHQIGFSEAPEGYCGTVDFWSLDSGVSMHRTVDSGTRLTRTQRHLRVAAPERFSVVLKLRGESSVTVRGAEHVVRSGDMWILDQTSPHTYDSRGAGGVEALNIDYERLNLTVDVVRSAQAHLRASPLYEIFRAHLRDLFAAVDVLGDEGRTRALTASATLALAEALVTTAAKNPQRL